MENTKAFLHSLVEKGKKPAYVEMGKELLDSLYAELGKEQPSPEGIDRFVRKRWSGYASRDRATYQILNEYANFCDSKTFGFTTAFREHVRITFEAEARKAMSAYKQALVPIPGDTKIDPHFLNELTNDAFVKGFRALQNLVYTIHDAIDTGSPFDWGWPDWKGITAEGLNQNRVMLVLAALAGSGQPDGDGLVVDKKRFGGYSVCKPMATTSKMLAGFGRTGLRITGLADKKANSFLLTSDTPNLLRVFHAYFQPRPDGRQNHIKMLSYRFVEDPATQHREPLFLAKTDGEPERLREMYYWLYDEAVKHGFSPQGDENMGCYVYKKGKLEWLLLGSGSSYHEDEFLHSPDYLLAAKSRFYHVFQSHPERMQDLRKRFPDSFGRPWTQCFHCKAGYMTCKNRVLFKRDGGDYYHCGTKHHLYFHNPDLNDLKELLELYKIENKIESL